MHIVLRETSPLFQSSTAKLAGDLGLTYAATSNLVNRKPVASKTIASVLRAFPSYSFEAQFEVVPVPPVVASRRRGRPAVLDLAVKVHEIKAAAFERAYVPMSFEEAQALAGDVVEIDGYHCDFTHYPDGTDGVPIEHVELDFGSTWAVRYFPDGAAQVNIKAPLCFIAPLLDVRSLAEVPSGGMLGALS